MLKTPVALTTSKARHTFEVELDGVDEEGEEEEQRASLSLMFVGIWVVVKIRVPFWLLGRASVW